MIRWVVMKMSISTHILTRRMTKQHRQKKKQHRHFNSHPHKEDDFRICLEYIPIHHFNSHPHKEDDSNFKQNLFI